MAVGEDILKKDMLRDRSSRGTFFILLIAVRTLWKTPMSAVNIIIVVMLTLPTVSIVLEEMNTIKMDFTIMELVIIATII